MMLKFSHAAAALLSVNIGLVALPAFAGEALMLYGGQDHDQFLGCMNCSEYNTDSMNNQYGRHGSKYSSTSIFNEYGRYGSKYSSTSACNPLAMYPPVIVDTDGNFYGYLTINSSNPKANRELFGFLSGVCR